MQNSLGHGGCGPANSHQHSLNELLGPADGPETSSQCLWTLPFNSECVCLAPLSTAPTSGAESSGSDGLVAGRWGLSRNASLISLPNSGEQAPPMSRAAHERGRLSRGQILLTTPRFAPSPPEPSADGLRSHGWQEGLAVPPCAVWGMTAWNVP